MSERHVHNAHPHLPTVACASYLPSTAATRRNSFGRFVQEAGMCDQGGATPAEKCTLAPTAACVLRALAAGVD